MTLDEVVGIFGARKVGDGYLAHCPAHEDRQASLSVGEGTDGRVLLHCFAGCALEDVLGHYSLSTKDLFPQQTPDRSNQFRSVPEVVYDYRDEHGKLLFQVCRGKDKEFRQRQVDSAGRFIHNVKGVRRVLYRLDKLKGHPSVFVVEGEKDADRLCSVELAATTCSGGATKWTDDHARQLRDIGCSQVVILPDNDNPGREHGRMVAESCRSVGLAVRIVQLPDLPEKGDVSDFLDNHPVADLQRIVAETPNSENADAVPADAVPADSASEPDGTTARVPPYVFEPAFEPTHFVGQWIERFSKQCDAALEFHEAAALVALAQATPALRAHISGSADGLRTNLYVLFVGHLSRTGSV